VEIKILIVGDSFACAALAGAHGWPNKLTEYFSVTNIARPGVGEYKILQGLKEALISNSFDLIIVSHTSPNRINCQTNPLYPLGHMYHTSDIIFADVENKLSTNPVAKSFYDYFCLAFDPEYYEYIHTRCCQDIIDVTKKIPTIHMTHFDWSQLYPIESLMNFYQLWQNNKGQYNHYNIQGNEIIFNWLLTEIDSLTGTGT
jgi:hypothetical protein